MLRKDGSEKDSKIEVYDGMEEVECKIEKVSRDERSSCADQSVSGAILPSLGVNSNRRIKLRPYIISPFDPRYRVWENFLVVLVFYTAWVSPYEFGFLKRPKPPLSIIDNVVNGFFFIDIVLTFFVAYLEKTTFLLIDDQGQIATKYLTTWFFFDLISVIPVELVRHILPNNVESYGYFSLLRLWRLRRASAMFQRLY